MTTVIKITPDQDSTDKKTYENYQDIVDKISKSDTMSGADKYMLQFNINEVLPKEEHIEIFKIVVKNTNKRTFTPGKNSTFIDLNDLSPSTLWKLHYYVSFCLDNIKRGKKIDELRNENELKRQEFEQKIQEELKQKYANGEIKATDTLPTKNRLYTFANMPSYETLRDQAIYHANPVSAEQIKITQMKQLNKQKELTDKDKKKNDFFHAYTNKKDTTNANTNANTKNNITLVKIPHKVEDNPSLVKPLHSEDPLGCKATLEKPQETPVVVHKIKIRMAEEKPVATSANKAEEEAEEIEICDA